MSIAIVTGSSRGLGRALAGSLVERGWTVVGDGRSTEGLAVTTSRVAALAGGVDAAAVGRFVAVPGDITDPDHRRALVAAAADVGGLDLLVNNAGGLGPSPLPRLVDADVVDLHRLFGVNVVAPLALLQGARPLLAASRRPTVVNITSDAAAEGYEGWGVYGATKAALEQLGRVLAVEEPGLRVLTVDPGDMRTRMHQEAFPGEDISDRPMPEAKVPGLLDLIEGDRPSGRYVVEADAEVVRS